MFSLRFFIVAVLLGCLCGIVRAEAVPAIARGQFDVGTTCFALKKGSLELANRCLAGFRARDREAKEVWTLEQMLQDADSVRSVSVPLRAPEPALGDAVRVFYVLLYPTAENQRADGKVLEFTLPHLQKKGEALLPAKGSAAFPLIVYSHAYSAHALVDVGDMATLASHGYVVALVFHGDGRFKQDYPWPWLYDVRAESVQRIIAQLRTDKDFSPITDFDRVGTFGVTIGAAAGLTLTGGTTRDGKVLVKELLVHAVFAEAPSVDSFLLAKGGTVDKVAAPVFAVVGGNDARSFDAKNVVAELPRERVLVELPSEGRALDADAKRIVATTWAVHFFNAYLKGDGASRAVLQRAEKVEGAVENKVVVRAMEESNLTTQPAVKEK